MEQPNLSQAQKAKLTAEGKLLGPKQAQTAAAAAQAILRRKWNMNHKIMSLKLCV